MKAVRLVLRLLGWLLTPLVAWAASFLGATVAAWLSTSLASTAALVTTMAAGAAAALVALLLWLRLLRRSPALRRTLEVAPDGTPVAAADAETGGAA